MENKQSGDLTPAGGQFSREKEYWTTKLSGDPVKTTFPYDFIKPGKGGSETEYRSYRSSFSGELFEKLTALSNKSDHRLHMILTAGVLVALHRYTGHNDITVGTTIDRQDTEGDFINTVLPLRNRLGGT